MSFSFSEKFIFTFGILGFLATVDSVFSLSFYGIALWYFRYLITNSFSHENCEPRSAEFIEKAGKYETTTTYHALHHSRYIKNYGFSTRFLDRWFGTEWDDYEEVFKKVSKTGQPLNKFNEKIKNE